MIHIFRERELVSDKLEKGDSLNVRNWTISLTVCTVKVSLAEHLTKLVDCKSALAVNLAGSLITCEYFYFIYL